MADIYIDPYAAFDGSGSIGSPRKVIPSLASGNNYYIRRGTTLTQAAIIALSGLTGVTFDCYGGDGDIPVIDAAGAFVSNFTIANCVSVIVRNMRCINATNANGVISVSGASDQITLERLRVLALQTTILVSSSGCTNVIVQDSTLESYQMNNQGVEFAAVGAGCKARRNTITHLGPDRTQTSLYGVYVNLGAAVEVSSNTIKGFYNGVELRADGCAAFSNQISDCNNAGVSIRDMLNGSVYLNRMDRIWNGLEYNGGAGAGLGGGSGNGVQLLDIGGGVCGNNLVFANQMFTCYQGVVSQADFTGGNYFWSNLIVRPRVNCINYQDKAGVGKIWLNTCIVAPVDSVLPAGHGVGVQLGGVATAADIFGNLIQAEVLASNSQCVAIGGTAGTNYLAVALNYNLYNVLNGAHLGQINSTNYDSLVAWQGALAGVAQITTKDPSPNTLAGDPGLSSSYRPTLLGLNDCPYVMGALDAYGNPRGNPATRGAIEAMAARVNALPRAA